MVILGGVMMMQAVFTDVFEETYDKQVIGMQRFTFGIINSIMCLNGQNRMPIRMNLS